jgi:hypothetical protein
VLRSLFYSVLLFVNFPIGVTAALRAAVSTHFSALFTRRFSLLRLFSAKQFTLHRTKYRRAVLKDCVITTVGKNVAITVRTGTLSKRRIAQLVNLSLILVVAFVLVGPKRAITRIMGVTQSPEVDRAVLL